jgi:hypothetical protein
MASFTKLRKENAQLASATHRLKVTAADSKNTPEGLLKADIPK